MNVPKSIQEKGKNPNKKQIKTNQVNKPTVSLLERDQLNYMKSIIDLSGSPKSMRVEKSVEQFDKDMNDNVDYQSGDNGKFIEVRRKESKNRNLVIGKSNNSSSRYNNVRHKTHLNNI